MLRVGGGKDRSREACDKTMEINQVRNDSGLDQTVKAVRSMPIYPFILQIIIDGVLCQALFFFFFGHAVQLVGSQFLDQ